MSKKNYLKPITLSKPPKVLFLGNGINRLFPQSCVSWEKLLKLLGEDSFENIYGLPSHLKAQLIKNNNEKYSRNGCTDAFREQCMKWCNEILIQEKKDFIKKLLENNYDSILTTNFSYEIEKTLQLELDCNLEETKPPKKDNRTYFFHKYRKYTVSNESTKSKKTSKSTKNISKKEKSLYCYFCLKGNKRGETYREIPYVWHIHGEAEKYKEAVLDLHSYGRNLTVIQNYINKFIASVMASVTSVKEEKKGKLFPKSWLDYFLLGDIKIVGFTFDYSEFDLWWLLNERLRVIEILKERIIKEFKLGDSKKVDKYVKFGKVTFYDADPKADNDELSAKARIFKAFGCGYEPEKLSDIESILNSDSELRNRNIGKAETDEDSSINTVGSQDKEEQYRKMYDWIIEELKK